jgi:hypothetical protein
MGRVELRRKPAGAVSSDRSYIGALAICFSTSFAGAGVGEGQRAVLPDQLQVALARAADGPDLVRQATRVDGGQPGQPELDRFDVDDVGLRRRHAADARERVLSILTTSTCALTLSLVPDSGLPCAPVSACRGRRGGARGGRGRGDGGGGPAARGESEQPAAATPAMSTETASRAARDIPSAMARLAALVSAGGGASSISNVWGIGAWPESRNHRTTRLRRTTWAARTASLQNRRASSTR